MRKIGKHKTGVLQGGERLDWKVFTVHRTVRGRVDMNHMTLFLVIVLQQL